MHNINNTPTKPNNTNDSKKREITDDEAAVKIQSSFRGFKTREELRKHVFIYFFIFILNFNFNILILVSIVLKKFFFFIAE